MFWSTAGVLRRTWTLDTTLTIDGRARWTQHCKHARCARERRGSVHRASSPLHAGRRCGVNRAEARLNITCCCAKWRPSCNQVAARPPPRLARCLALLPALTGLRNTRYVWRRRAACNYSSCTRARARMQSHGVRACGACHAHAGARVARALAFDPFARLRALGERRTRRWQLRAEA